MKYRIDCSLFFENNAEGLVEYDKTWTMLNTLLAKNITVNVNVGKINEQKSEIKRHKCLHDEDKSCSHAETSVKSLLR